jgi:hypothetical protein
VAELTETKVVDRVVEKVVEHDPAGRITKITERHLTPEPTPGPKPEPGPDSARLFELEADSAFLHALEALGDAALEVVEHPENLAKTKQQPMTMTIEHFGGLAPYADKSHVIETRRESSALLKVLCAVAQWSKVHISFDAPRAEGWHRIRRLVPVNDDIRTRGNSQ